MMDVNNMDLVTIIEEKITKALSPATLDVINESHLHASHASSPNTGVSHFRLTIISDKFTDLNLLARQRMVHDILKDELSGSIHALSLTTKSPNEVS